MEKVVEEIMKCRKCTLWKTRKNPVPGEGNIKAEVMFIGEAPGKSEDEQGRPFVGAAGKLLTRLIESIGLKREDVYIANILKCRPPQNRDPLPEEIEKCTPYLDRQIQIIKPKIIVTLGRHSTSYILGKLKVSVPGIMKIRGKTYSGTILGLKVIILPTLHPAAALYNPKMRSLIEADFKNLKRILEGNLKQVDLLKFLSSKAQ
ncbi:MAG: type-4 uracil-DNA glycosylase [archaeon GB-1867-005]|nr:type-4 uracil-DNA glycosylase [Candidatus Culexmicrobium cathedralense]